MAKIAILFVAALAFHATLAGLSGTQQSQLVRELLKQIQENTNDASNLIQNAQIDNTQGKRALRSQANELIHKLQNANYHLQRAILHNQDSQVQQLLEQIALGISGITHSLEQTINTDPNQLKTKLKTLLQDISSEAEKLNGIVQQHIQKDQQNQENIAEELEKVLEKLLEATRQLKIRRQLVTKSQQEIKQKIQQITTELTTTIQGISSNDKSTAVELSHETHELSHALGRITHLLRSDAHLRLQGETGNTVLEVVHKLIEIRASLDQAANSQGRDNAQAWINETKNVLKSKITEIGSQMERLALLLKTGNESNQDIQDTNNLIRNILADTLAGARRLQLQLENIDETKN